MANFNIHEFEKGMKSNNQIKLEIDGQEIPYMSNYAYFDAKSYYKEPVRSANGVIENLDSYATFLTPRLIFSFKFMPVETYRFLMKKIKEKNEFKLKVYDMVEDTYFIKKMYFYPKDFPQIYQYDLYTLAVRDETFELVGTNAELDKVSIVYNSNPPIETVVQTSGITKNYSDDFVIGEYDSDVGTDPFEFSYNGYYLIYYNSKQDGTGINYYKNDVIDNLSNDMVLYAQWSSTNQYVLSFDYGEMVIDEQTDTISKNVVYGQAIGTLPTPTRQNYNFLGWYSLPSGQGQQITSSTVYNYKFNKTIYAKWELISNNGE